jgi:hypothetical protein
MVIMLGVGILGGVFDGYYVYMLGTLKGVLPGPHCLARLIHLNFL